MNAVNYAGDDYTITIQSLPYLVRLQGHFLLSAGHPFVHFIQHEIETPRLGSPRADQGVRKWAAQPGP